MDGGRRHWTLPGPVLSSRPPFGSFDASLDSQHDPGHGLGYVHDGGPGPLATRRRNLLVAARSPDRVSLPEWTVFSRHFRPGLRMRDDACVPTLLPGIHRALYHLDM